MSRYLTPRHFVRIAVVGFMVSMAAWAAVHSRRGEDSGTIAPIERDETNALVSELARCRTVKTDATAELEDCRRVWADNRRQFFGPTKTALLPAGPIPTTAPASGKIQDRVSPVEAEHQHSEVR
jgi:conjugative transfer region protein TrbK